MWRPLEGYGAPLGDCGCGCNGFGAAGLPARRYPAIEQTLRDYIAAKSATGQYFYLTPQLNTAKVRQSTFGDVTVLSTDPTSDPITSAASDIGGFFSNLWGNATPPDLTSLVDSAGNWLPGVQGPASSSNSPVATLPTDITAPVASAAKTDLFGNPLSPWIIGGAAALLLVVGVAAAMPAKGGRRRR